ncbi:hypothetical protein SAMN05444406_12313 [Caldicoprobacter faecalis]|uniref:Uncharacterized protein n=1 Tax=Caldicoprobacter faecalis TaxID=937334 RepID=A0A1I5X8Y5_9FIRM|nr:hypothetical protein SAMN05444406_12313 [Caldicoprobacter faecalis]
MLSKEFLFNNVRIFNYVCKIVFQNRIYYFGLYPYIIMYYNITKLSHFLRFSASLLGIIPCSINI